MAKIKFFVYIIDYIDNSRSKIGRGLLCAERLKGFSLVCLGGGCASGIGFLPDGSTRQQFAAMIKRTEAALHAERGKPEIDLGVEESPLPSRLEPCPQSVWSRSVRMS